MSDPAPLSMRGAAAPRFAEIGDLRLIETRDRALASLALRRGAAADGAANRSLCEMLGGPPPEPGQWRGGGVLGAFWTGPDQWMIEAPGRAETDFAAELRRAAPGCSIAEQTDGWASFDLISTKGAAPLQRLFERLIDLDPKALAPGAAVRTAMRHLSVFVIRREASTASILGPRSTAETLWTELERAAARIAES